MKQHQDEESLTTRLIAAYGFCFAFSLSVYGLIFLSIKYVACLNGTQKISKLSLRAYIFGIHFLFWQSLCLLCFESMS